MWILSRWKGIAQAKRALREPDKYLVESAVTAFGRDHGPEAAGVFAAHLIRDVPPPGETPVILCLYRLHFGKDIAELKRRSELRWVRFKAGPLSAARFLGWLQWHWVPAELRRQMRLTGAKGPAAERAMALTGRFARAFLREVRRRFRVDAVMGANIDYWQDEAIVRICGEEGIPFLVLCREIAGRQDIFDAVVKLYRGAGFRFEGTAVALGAESHAKLMIEAGVCTADQTVVTGFPRFDVWRDLEQEEGEVEGPRLITLVSFRDARYGAPAVFREILLLIADEAAGPGRGDVEFLVKCKNGEDERECRRLLEPVQADRLRFEVEMPMFDIFRRSSLIIGFASAAMMEGLLSDAAIAAPAWGEAERVSREGMLRPDDVGARELIEFPASREALRGLVKRAVAGELKTDPAARPRRRELFRRYSHFPEERTCCAEVDAFVRRFLG